jgi:hypothetical protein
MLLGHNTGGGAVVLRPSRSQYGTVWISDGPLSIYIYIVDYMCMQLRMMSVASENPERDNDLSRGMESFVGGQCDYTNMDCARRRQQPDLIHLKPQCTGILCTHKTSSLCQFGLLFMQSFLTLRRYNTVGNIPLYTPIGII